MSINLNGRLSQDFYLESANSWVTCPKEGGGYIRSFVKITSLREPGVVAEDGFAAALNAGQRIGSAQTFDGTLFLGAFTQAEGCRRNRTDGYWIGNGAHYLGLTVTGNDGTHYAWALLSVTCPTGCNKGITVDLTGYAYETVIGKPIAAGRLMDKREEAIGSWQRSR